MTSKMYNVQVKFETDDNPVIIGVEGTSDEDVYNFLPCIIPAEVKYELISIEVDENTTPDMERKKQARNNDIKARYQAIYQEFVQICENMNDKEHPEGLAIVMDITKEEFFICSSKQAESSVDASENFRIMVMAEPNENNEEEIEDTEKTEGLE
jgi:hypothetical protein